MEIGIIGLGDMGKVYLKKFAKAGYKVNGSDLPKKINQLKKELNLPNVNILDDCYDVVKTSDFIIYSVETENILNVVKKYGPMTKTNATVAGQTSVKTPEIEAFEKYLPKSTNIITCHSLHGSTVDTIGQTLIVINHRSHNKAYDEALKIFKTLESNIVEIENYKDHDKIIADTQTVTHMGFLSMGTAWKNAGIFPWEDASYSGGIDNVKVLLTLRIYGGKSHVYSGLAIMNPFAREQIKQYVKSESELFKLMIQENENEFRERIKKAGEFVFGNEKEKILLDDSIMGEFSLGFELKKRKENSHLSILTMIDTWHKLKINPYKNLICETPPFRLRLGIAEYLFRNKKLFEESLNAAIHNKSIRGNDLEFHSAVREWASIIEHQDIEGYSQKFNNTQVFFNDRIPEAKIKSTELIKRLTSIK